MLTRCYHQRFKLTESGMCCCCMEGETGCRFKWLTFRSASRPVCLLGSLMFSVNADRCPVPSPPASQDDTKLWPQFSISRRKKQQQSMHLIWWHSEIRLVTVKYVWWHSELRLVTQWNTFGDTVKFVWWHSEIRLVTQWSTFGDIVKYVWWHREMYWIMQWVS